MAVVSVKDQNGQPVAGITVRLAFQGQSTDQALFEQILDAMGNTDFGYAAAGIISINANATPDQKWTLWCNMNPAYNPNWANIQKLGYDVPGNGVAAFQQDVNIQLLVSGQQPGPGPIQGYGTCQQWKDAVFDIWAKHDFQTVGPDNEGMGPNQAPFLRATIDEIQALYSGPNRSYVQWQHESVGTPPELRPRLFLPHGGSDKFKRYADIGDWMTPIKWEHCSE